MEVASLLWVDNIGLCNTGIGLAVDLRAGVLRAVSLAWNASSAARSRSSPSWRAATGDPMGAETNGMFRILRRPRAWRPTGQTQGELA